MDRFVRVYSGGELVKGPNGVEFGSLPEEGLWFKGKPAFGELIDAVYKKLGWEPTQHTIRAQGRLNVGGGAHRHFIMVPVDDDMSWSNYVKAVFNGTEWNCLEIFVQAENCSLTEGIPSERAVMAIEPNYAQRQNGQPQNPELDMPFFIPSMVTASPPNAHPQNARQRKPRKSIRTFADNGGQVADSGNQDKNGTSEAVDTISYELIGQYDADHRACALASGQIYMPERVMRQFGLHQVCPPPLRDTSVELHWCRRGRVHNDWAQKHKTFVDMWEAKEQDVVMEDRPYDHSSYMDYLRWYRRSTRIRLCTPKRISIGHKGGASGGIAIADSEDPFRASQLRYTPRAHLIHSVTDKLTILAKEATSQKGCSRGECRAFVEQVTRTCVEVIADIGGSSLCDIVDLVPRSSTAAIAAVEPYAEQQRDEEEDIHHSTAPDQETESGLDSEKRSRFQNGRTQAGRKIQTRSSGKRKRGRSGSR
uniref:Aminotransferase-like plant mobile domain-containing protein n=1 Tax=Leersia perrieri TaxID=77586 RepID=A0A0D9UX77_9ORYZ